MKTDTINRKSVDHIAITVRRESVHFEQHEAVAVINGEPLGYVHLGSSVAEAIGEAVLCLVNDGHAGADCLPFVLDLDIQSDEPALSS